MGCFPACFGHLRRDLTTKKVQHQCLSPSNEQHESVKLLTEKTESQKEEEIVANPIKLISQFEEETVSDDSNAKKVSNESENGKVEMEREKEREESLLMSEKEESCCSSLFTLSIDSRRQFFAAEMGEKEVSSLLKIKINNNTSSKHQDEEKESKDPMIEEQKSDRQCKGNEMAVETSLSSWLVDAEKSPESENNYGAIADISKLNGISTPTPCCSGDEQPGIGTVGRYWRQRGEATSGEVSSGLTGGLASVEAS
ncbi:uncharacterized protein LOC131006071 [Salvia miltiorrhiza]|uniref:uncharacterized protein LOC131006071 n=1 Tax=Salvia miltiorrhiza TaxID=226208 RepID=UPI0025AD4FA3|nr:uncharacterized protein LOC131006071 [Salvia miltiorrhiza]